MPSFAQSTASGSPPSSTGKKNETEESGRTRQKHEKLK